MAGPDLHLFERGIRRRLPVIARRCAACEVSTHHRYPRFAGGYARTGDRLRVGRLRDARARQGIHVHGVTISPAQLEYARARVSEAGLHDLVPLELRDYRTLDGQCDGIVSIETVEAVGEPFWPAYFAILRECLGPGACALVQTITIDTSHFAAYSATSDFIREFIFPGGMLPSPQRFAAAARRGKLVGPRLRGDLASLAVRFRNADRADPRAGLRRDFRAPVAAVSGVLRSGLRRRTHGRDAVRSGEGRMRGRLRRQPRTARSRRRRMSSQRSRAPLRKSRTSTSSRSYEKGRVFREEQARAQRLHEANEAYP